MKHRISLFLPLLITLVLFYLPTCRKVWRPTPGTFFAVFAGAIVGLILEPLPGAVVGPTAVVIITLGSEWLLFSPEQQAAAHFNLPAMSFKWAVSGFSNSTAWLIFSAFMFTAGYENTRFGRRLALLLVKYLGRRTLTLGYAIAFADLLLAPFTPYNTARSGGTLYPIISNLLPLYGSKTNDPSARLIGSYLMWAAITAICITSSMFLSALEPNLLALSLVKNLVGIAISWGTWFLAFLLIGIVLLLSLLLLAYWLYPPGVKRNAEVPRWVESQLKKLVALSRKEILLLIFVCLALLCWIFATAFIEPTVAELVMVVLMLFSDVLDQSDITGNKPAWNTFFWLATLFTLAAVLLDVGFIAWLGKLRAQVLSGI